MLPFKTTLASLLILGAGASALAAATDGLRAFTSETARRIEVREHPRVVPAVRLQGADGNHFSLDDLRGRWLLVDFIYTRCATWCSVQGSLFAQLQRRLAGPLAADRVRLLSLSFDPGHDDPARLADYQRRAGNRGPGWIAARPTSAADLHALLDSFGVTAIDDGLGGYVHNAAIAVVDPRGRLVAIVDWNAPAAAEDIVRAGLRQ